MPARAAGNRHRPRGPDLYVREHRRPQGRDAVASQHDVGIDFDHEHALSNQPYQAIIDAAKRHGCDAIFMGSHGRKGLSKLWYGSETEEVLTHSKIPMVVYR